MLRHEPATDDDEESFVARRKSAIISRPAASGKGRRSLEDMMASQPNELAQSLYALERIAAQEDVIERILRLCSPEARELVLRKRPSLSRFLDEEKEEE